ncbi:MAG TPA: amino acid racemase [Rhizomicrobium sp.]|nr:amino acid racemase [Rhizomicrobium sp.]
MAARDKTVGVIGGMGPEATVDFLRRIVEGTPARDDADHIRVLVDNNPKIPSRIAALIEGTGEDPTPVLIAMARGLERQGADFLTVPCNTAHYYLPAIAHGVNIPVLDMIALAIARLGALQPRPKTIGMLASPAVQKVGLYAERLGEAGFEALFPEAKGEAAVFATIRAVKAKAITEQVRAGYESAIAGLHDAGADAFLIACTELSLLPPPQGRPFVDALDALVDETISFARGG